MKPKIDDYFEYLNTTFKCIVNNSHDYIIDLNSDLFVEDNITSLPHIRRNLTALTNTRKFFIDILNDNISIPLKISFKKVNYYHETRLTVNINLLEAKILICYSFMVEILSINDCIKYLDKYHRIYNSYYKSLTHIVDYKRKFIFKKPINRLEKYFDICKSYRTCGIYILKDSINCERIHKNISNIDMLIKFLNNDNGNDEIFICGMKLDKILSSHNTSKYLALFFTFKPNKRSFHISYNEDTTVNSLKDFITYLNNIKLNNQKRLKFLNS